MFPAVPVRQWVLTLPMQLRFLLAWRPRLIGLTLTLFLRALFAWQRSCARRQGISKPLCGAVTCIQRFGPALNLNRHFHTLVPDGVFFEDSEGNVQFHPLPPPTVPNLEKLARRLIPRLLNKFVAESEQTEDTDWMHLLTRNLQTQSGRAAPTIERPAACVSSPKDFRSTLGSLSPSWTATRSNDSLATALVRRFHCTESP